MNKDCPNCSHDIGSEINICEHCGWRPYHSLLKKNAICYPIFRMNYKFAGINSVILFFLMAILYTYPLWGQKDWFSEGTKILLLETLVLLVIILFLLQIHFLYKYLLNFYHPLDNIFKNIRWVIFSVVLLSILVIIAVSFQYSRTIDGLFMFAAIGLYVLWAFMLILIGWSLIKADSYDYVGGISVLGYSLLASGILPVLIILVPLSAVNLFFKAQKYSKLTSVI